MRIVAALTALLAAGSFALCWFLFSPGVDGATRAYEGTTPAPAHCWSAQWQRSGGALVALRTPRLVVKRFRTIPVDFLELLALGGIAALAWRMRWIGERSYGIYLWQTPVIVFSQGLTGRSGWQLNVANVVVTIGLCALS